MSKANNLKDYLTDLYQGIASKKPGASRNPQNFRAEIESIQVGSNPTLISKTFAANGTYSASSYGADGFSKVVVDVESGAGGNGMPIMVYSETEMTALLSSAQIGSIYKYMGATGTYENGALYVVAEEGVKLISFTIDGTTYQAEEGMTWQEWLSSEYNTDAFFLVQTEGVARWVSAGLMDGSIASHYVVVYNDVPVLVEDLIETDRAYVISVRDIIGGSN